MPNMLLSPRPLPHATLRKLVRRNTLLAIALALCAPAALADAGSAPELERAHELAQQARTLRNEAENTFRATERSCYEQFRVNRCLDNARQTRLEQIRQAREMDIEARRLELAVKQREAAAAGVHAPAREATRNDESHPAPILAPADNAAAEAIRAQRKADAAAAEARAQADRERRDIERAEARIKAEEAAAERAEKAARDRQRYDERIRKRQAED